MERDRAWRRWRGLVKLYKTLHRRRINGRLFYRHDISEYPFTYGKKNSVSETIYVSVRSNSEYEYFDLHLAKLNRDNPTSCSCWICCNPRRAGIGNSRGVLSHKEGIALQSSVEEMVDSNINTPNSHWRSRKYGRSTHRNQSNDLL